ncbi:MAG: hypothetical protein WD824_24905 [Cyclobacteriaceae bacterium]
MSRIFQSLLLSLFHFFIFITPGFSQFNEVKHRDISGNEVAVTAAGSYGVAGTTYLLMNDITSTKSTLFLGKDVTLDLNGYTVRYADGPYEHVPNSGFEEGTRGWDLSKAPGAKVVNTEEVHVFVGEKLMSLAEGDEIVSPYINLPVGNRSYLAMCGVTGHFYHDMNGDLNNQMKVSVYVEDAGGKNVVCTTHYGDTTMVSCPVEKRAPRLGGGVIYAHLNNLPAGKYRIRIKADTDCLVDEIDIRPAMDVGIGIVEKTLPMGHYDHLFNSIGSAFFDYTANPADSTPLSTIPVAKGSGTVTIKNGTIESGVVGILSYGIQSTAENVKIILDNVKIVTRGINTIAVDAPQATITSCRFDVESPFIINRHGSSFYAVDLSGPHPSEVSYSEFYGGQGCLVFKGNRSSVHHNHFVNRQMVTNHYSIMAMGDSSHIFENYIEPEVGSGVEIFRHKFIDIFNNTIKIKTSPPTCEYGHGEYSTAAIRMADYRSKAGDPNGCYGNRVFSNKIFITASDYPHLSFYIPMAWAVYYSASAGDNLVFGNDITVEDTDPQSKAEAAAFYVCGGPEGFGGRFYNNRITTNVPAAWVASMYGGTANTKIFNNRIIKSPSAGKDFKAIWIGFKGCDWCVAKDVEFRSNIIEGNDFDLQVSEQDHSFSVYWTLDIELKDKKGNPLKNSVISILDKNKQNVASGKTDEQGKFTAELLEFKFANREKTFFSPHTIVAGKDKKEVLLNANTKVTMVTKK